MNVATRIAAETEWLDAVRAKIIAKMPAALEKARANPFIPYTSRDGRWLPTRPNMWTNGFWPGSMWQLYLWTNEETYRAEAERCEKILDEALTNIEMTSHDVGFMWKLSSGVNFMLTGAPESRRRTLMAANLLAGRFNPAGFLRAWNGAHQIGWAIIDCMMNLPILYWASEETGDPRFRKIAMAHADTTLRHFVRPDGSVNHIVVFDPETGAYLDNPAGQGAYSGSSWSRGQAWGLYGFTLSYLHTGEARYLDAAKRIAAYFITNVQDSFIPKCDFRQNPDDEIFDNAAGAIAACGLIEIARAVPEPEKMCYLEPAIRMLKAMDATCADWTDADPAIFQKCTVRYDTPAEHHITMTYADYFFIEAVGKLNGNGRMFW